MIGFHDWHKMKSDIIWIMKTLFYLWTIYIIWLETETSLDELYLLLFPKWLYSFLKQFEKNILHKTWHVLLIYILQNTAGRNRRTVWWRIKTIKTSHPLSDYLSVDREKVNISYLFHRCIAKISKSHHAFSNNTHTHTYVYVMERWQVHEWVV